MLTWAVVYLVTHGADIQGSVMLLAMLGDVVMVIGGIVAWHGLK